MSNLKELDLPKKKKKKRLVHIKGTKYENYCGFLLSYKIAIKIGSVIYCLLLSCFHMNLIHSFLTFLII